MKSARLAPVLQTLFTLSLVSALDAGAISSKDHSETGVRFAKSFEIVSSDSLTGYLAAKVKRLTQIDPNKPPEPGTEQTFSLFGREDIIAATSRDYRANGCAPLTATTDILDEIATRARNTSIVIISESHERSEHRGFIAQVASRLRPLGYDTLAIETLSNSPPGAEKYAPPFVKQPDLPYLTDEDGYYLAEAGFGRLGRQAKALGYRLVPYEFTDYENVPPNASQAQQIAMREEGQAKNLEDFLRKNPKAKLLVHVGYSHAAEVPRPDGSIWMAARLKEKTGIDPLTISQTRCRGSGATARFAALPADESPGTFDLLVDHLAPRFVQGRPEWRRLAGDKIISIPKALRPTSGWRIIEARRVGEPISSVPMDRVAIRPGENIALMLPPGRYQLRAIDVKRADPIQTKPAN